MSFNPQLEVVSGTSTDGSLLVIAPTAAVSASSQAQAVGNNNPTPSTSQSDSGGVATGAVQPNAFGSTTSESGSAATAAAQPDTSDSSSTVSTGALAGGIIGGFAAGALIAFFLTWFILSRRRQPARRRFRRHSSRSAAKQNGDSPSTLEKSSMPLVDRRHAWELHLPQPTDDASLRKAMKTLYDRLELHVENFYSVSSAHEVVDEAEWNAAVQQVDSPYLPTSIEALLYQTSTVTAVMKHCLSYLVISGIDVHANCSFPLLPDEVTSITHAAAKSNVNKPVLRQALSRHAQLTMYLLAPVSETLPQYSAHRDAIISSAVHAFCTAFAPWGTPPSTFDTRKENLIQILREASDVGLLLYGQPSKFEWRWKHAGLDAGQVIVAPTFIRIPDDSSAVDTELLSRRIGVI